MTLPHVKQVWSVDCASRSIRPPQREHGVNLSLVWSMVRLFRSSCVTLDALQDRSLSMGMSTVSAAEDISGLV
jgi:hypothetical protein